MRSTRVWILILAASVAATLAANGIAQPIRGTEDWKAILRNVTQLWQRVSVDDEATEEMPAFDGTWPSEDIVFLPSRPLNASRVGTVNASTTRNGWWEYRNSASKLSISFPSDDWKIREQSLYSSSSEAVHLVHRSLIRSISIYYAGDDTATAWKILAKIAEASIPAQIELGGSLADVYENVQIGAVDLGVPVYGRVFYFPKHDLVILSSEYEPDYPSSEYNLAASEIDGIIATINFK